MCRWWAEKLALLLETFLRLPSFLPDSFRAALLQPEQLPLLHSNVAEPLLPHALRICSPEAALSRKQGVPIHPLFKHLAFTLGEWMSSAVFPRAVEYVSGLSGEDHLEDKLNIWSEKIPQLLATLQELMQQVKLHLQVQESLFADLREMLPDTTYRVLEESFITKDGSRIKAQSSSLLDGNLVLLNNVLLYEAQLEHSYMSIKSTRKLVTLVLHDEDGTKAVKSGMLLARDLCKEEMDVSVPAMHLHCMAENIQPLKIMEQILEVLSIEGVKALLGFRSTIGSITEALPPSRSLLLASFLEANKTDVVGTKLTSGGRALAKHVHRSSSGWWGPFSGNDEKKNELALNSISYLIQHACWLNIHHMPPNLFVFEIRVKEGYGARWTADGTQAGVCCPGLPSQFG
ncbi:hypothetical protein GOP47_0017828 [Adiantum capillus-veneris]|uniref:Uncharacterized protein n=1 Tax=Adiantum capillus-veneris TaxID=13818 RepID=A0A9D4ZB72_ADICA|nr:hypothetical protein GOP47_0017828 [Adiantum capillus-veneris]